MNTHLAIMTGEINLIKERIETKKIHIDYSFGGLKALHLAVLYGQTDIVNLLLQAGADVNVLTDYESGNNFNIESRSTPLHISVEFDKLEILKILVEAGAKVDFSRSGMWQDTPLDLAVKRNNLEMVKCLLQGQMEEGNNKLMEKIFLAITKNDSSEMLKLFIERELIDPNLLLSYGKTLLYYAAENNKLSICEFLIDNGADVDFTFIVQLGTSRRGNLTLKDTSILTVAAATGNCELVKLLLDNGANPNGYTTKVPGNKDIPIIIAIKNNFPNIVALLIEEDADICIVEKGTYYNGSGTLLGLAIDNQYLDIVKLLIEAGNLNFNSGLHREGVLFEKAVSKGNEELILYLLKEGVVAEKYLSEGAKFFSCQGVETREMVQRLQQVASVFLHNNNKQTLIKFFEYLRADKESLISKLSEDLINLVADYAAADNSKLNSLTFENYVKYHPIEDDNGNMLKDVVLGESTCEVNL